LSQLWIVHILGKGVSLFEGLNSQDTTWTNFQCGGSRTNSKQRRGKYLTKWKFDVALLMPMDDCTTTTKIWFFGY
jgi:hypothetical protein